MTSRLSAVYADLARQVNERSRQLVRDHGARQAFEDDKGPTDDVAREA